MRLLWVSLAFVCAYAQNPVSDAIRVNYASEKRNLLEAVEKVPDTTFAYRPTAEVMTFGELVVHISNSNFSDCSVLKGEANPNAGDKKPVAKADVVGFLKSSYDYCDPVIAALADARLSDKVQRGTREVVKANSGVHILWHPSLHYGNLITYMRLKGIVPPETERAQAKPSEKQGPQMVTYYMVFLKKGPKWSPEVTPESTKIQAGHMENMKAQYLAGRLVLAGPFGDNGDLRGLQLFKAASLEEAKTFAAEDPAVKAGRLTAEIHPWLTEKGMLP
jgi:uncharacterized protein YciI/uncharacterized damage-inducible protein DinB